MKKLIFAFFLVTAGSVVIHAKDGPDVSGLSSASTIGTGLSIPTDETSDQTRSLAHKLKREQILGNLEQVAVLNQAYTVQMNELIKSSRIALAQEIGSEKVTEMTDQEVLSVFAK